MTPAELKTEIESGLMAAVLSDSWLAGNDSETARLLNVKDLPGYVPLNELSAYCLVNAITGGVQALDSLAVGAEIGDGISMTLPIKGVLKTVLTLMLTDFRLELADVLNPNFGAACDGLVGLGLMTAGNKSDILAMAQNRQSRAEALGFGFVTHQDVGNARNS